MYLNEELQTKLENEFKPMGIIAFTNCCGTRYCQDNYADDMGYKEIREKGIWFFRIHLNGMNYNDNVSSISVYYDDFDYLMDNWQSESEIINQWIAVISGEVSKIKKPTSEKECIIIFFKNDLKLEVEDEYI